MKPRRLAMTMALAWGCFGIAACEEDPGTGALPPRPTAAEHGADLFHDTALPKALFNAYACATCHEADGQAGTRTSRAGAPLAGVVERASYWGGAEVDLLRAVNYCLRFFMLQDQPWSGQEPEAIAIYAYLESLPSRSPDRDPAPFTIVRAIEDVAPGHAQRGAAVFARACSTCHGAAHTGASKVVDYAPTLPEAALEEHPLGLYTPEERRLVLIEKVRHGGFLGYGGQMPPFSLETLSDDELGDVLAFFGL
jgi:thiosulfate dehydrogenase